MSPFAIRDARLPEERPALLDFILGLQYFESTFEPDRRLDASVSTEYFDKIEKDVLKGHGRILVAEDGAGRLLGWAVVHEDDNDIYVLEEERKYGYISELFLIEEARGMGVGRALIAACERWTREHGLKVMMIGVLPGNTRAKKVYEDAGFSTYALILRKYL
jgi:GNAT superfamily N-acetyltransferase